MNRIRLHQQHRSLSFFKDLMGYSAKKLENPTQTSLTPQQELLSRIVQPTSSNTLTRREKYLRLMYPDRPKKIEEERILGGSYPPRGPIPPEKRLKEWTHTVRNLTLGPKKLNLVCKLIRLLPVEQARLQLRFSKKAISRDVLLALDKTCSIAREDINIHPKDLIVGKCFVGSEIVGKKVDIKARGKAGTIHVRHSHLTVVLYENPKTIEGFEGKILTLMDMKQPRKDFRNWKIINSQKERASSIPPSGFYMKQVQKS